MNVSCDLCFSQSQLRIAYFHANGKYYNRNQLIYVHKLLKGSIFIADSAKFKVPNDKYFDKRHKNSDTIFLKFYKNDSSISPYNIYKNQGTFPGDF